MKRYCLPTSFVEEVLPTIPADCQAILFALLWHSNNTMKPVWPSLPTIARRSGTKSPKTVRAKLAILAEKGVLNIKLVPSHRVTKNKKSYTIFHNHYSFNFAYWIQRDIENGDATAADFTDEAVKRSIVQETVKATLDNLPDELQKILDLLEPTGKFGNTHYFKVKNGVQLAPSFVHEQFKKHGLSIALTA